MKNIKYLIFIIIIFLSYHTTTANAQRINPMQYRFFSYISDSDYLIAENIPQNKFNLLLIYSDVKTVESMYGNIMEDSYTPAKIIKKYKKIELKLISFTRFKKISGVEGGTVYNPKYPCEAIIYNIDRKTFMKINPQKKYIKTEAELINLINALGKTNNNSNTKKL